MYGYGLLSSQLIRQFLVFASLNETCLWLNSLYDLRLENMENTIFQQIEGHGIHKHADS